MNILTESTMKQHHILRAPRLHGFFANVGCNLAGVKCLTAKLTRYSLAMFLFAGVTLGAPSAHAEDANTKAMLNSTGLLNYVSGVLPEVLPKIIESIHNGKVKRIAPQYPVWIINSDDGTLLYYQGQKGYRGQAASRLVDDVGFRFGLRAVDMARASRSTWLNLKLSGAEFRAYCASKAPFVVCTLIQP